MTARATFTAAAMREAIAAAKQGVRVELKPDGTLIIEPAAVASQDASASAFDKWVAKRGQG